MARMYNSGFRDGTNQMLADNRIGMGMVIRTLQVYLCQQLSVLPDEKDCQYPESGELDKFWLFNYNLFIYDYSKLL